MKCYNCNSENKDDSKFCFKCGTKLEEYKEADNNPLDIDKNYSIRCSNCNSENENDSKFCFKCGAKLEEYKEADSNSVDIDKEGIIRCSNCNSENEDDSQFCFKCGAKLENYIDINSDSVDIDKKDDITKYDTAEIDGQVIKENSKIKNTILKIIAKKASLNPYIFIAAAALIFLFLGGSIAFKSVHTKDTVLSANLVNSKKTYANKDEVLKEIHMLNEEYNIIPGQVESVKFYTYPENVNTSGLKWKSSNSNIKVNQSGYIISTTPNEEGTVTVSNTDGSVTAQCKVKVSTKEEAFFSTMNYINGKGIEEQSQVNLSIDKFTLGKRIASNKESTAFDIFQRINKELPSYQLTQKQFINAESKNKMDCDVYVDLTSGDIRKIVTVEYIKDTLEITDYYYMDGSIYFIFKRNENYYRPIPAEQDFSGTRYFYCGDSLIKWREIKKTQNDTFEKTDYIYNGNDFSWNTYEYNDLEHVDAEKASYVKANQDSNLQKQMEKEFLNREKTMLNAGYNIYNKVVEAPNITKVTGYVLSDQGQPMSGVAVRVFSEDYKLLVGETTTNNDGLYNIKVPMNDTKYSIYVDKPGYIETTINDIDSTLATSNLFQENVYMYQNSNQLYNITLDLVNALNGRALNGSDLNGTRVVIRRGINNKNGAIEREFQVSNAIFTVALTPGNYTAEVISSGCENSYFTISTLENNMEIHSNVVPKITNDEIRIVLSWGAKPNDLDSHLFLPNNNQVAYYSRTANNASLDLDDTNGYGPETITINNMENGTYKYYVADYTNCSGRNYSSMDMSNSFARVDVYTKNGLVASFSVPRNKQGVIWNVFDISNGKVIPVQRYFNNIEDLSWWSSNK